MTLQELHCRRCGATLPALDAAGAAVCQYCGQRYREGDVPAPPSPPTDRRRPLLAILLVGAATMVLAMTSVVAFLLVPHGEAPSRAPVEPIVPTAMPEARDAPPAVEGSSDLGIGLPPTPPPSEAYDTVFYKANLAYDSVGGPPQAITIDGRDAFLARFRASGGSDELFFVAAPAAGGPPIWKVGPLGTYSDGYRATHAATLGERVVVSDWRSTLHVLALATGREERALTLTDRVEELCASPRLSRVWLGQADERRFLLDPATGALEEGERPADCPTDPRRAHFSPPTQTRAREVEVPGMAVGRTFVSADLGVALGYRHPGTALPLIAGYDPATFAVRWTGPLADADPARVRAQEPLGAIANDRFVASYLVGSDEWYLAALDARTGARLWDVRMPDVFSVDHIYSVVVGKDHAYVGHMSSVEVYRLSDGALVRVAGQEVYEGPAQPD